MAKRVIITGASGLLGRHIYREFKADPGWHTLGLAFSRAKGELQKVDITQHDQVHNLFMEYKPTVVVHSAAERRPDNVENQQEATRKLNVDATKMICEEAGKVGAVVVYISTDYVFDGEHPPYQVDDKPNPLNKYGQSKLDGERAALGVSTDNMVLRVPIMYGDVEAVDESAVTVLLGLLMDTSKTQSLDNHQRRYPTHCADVAAVLRMLLDKRLQDSSLNGIFHWSGNEEMTKYEMTMTIAKAFNIPTAHILPYVPGPEASTAGVRRPYDAHLDPQRIKRLGIDSQSPYVDAIKDCLKPYVQ